MWKLIVLLAALSSTLYGRTPEIDELRIEVDDVKYALKTLQVDLGLLEERIVQNKEKNSLSLLSAQVNGLEKKINSLEKTFDKAANDLRALNTASSQALSKIQELEQTLQSHEKRLGEVVKLKGTLTTLSQAINPSPSSRTYRVKAGDSLEKIARNHHVSVEALRKMNNLQGDRIVPGQDLKTSND